MSAPLALRRGLTRRVSSTAPRCATLLALVVGLTTLAGLTGCDEKLQAYLKNASSRQGARDAKKAEDAELKERGLGPSDPISPEIARAIQVVRISDYDFIIRKDKAPKKQEADDQARRFNGFDFASTLESKSRWLGRGVEDLPTWLDEIGSSTFFSGDTYIVRLPDAREMSFRTWLLEELAALPPDVQEVTTP